MDRRTVKRVDSTFTALHGIMICPRDKIKFRSGKLDLIIPPGCTYSNDIMIESAVKRFIEGRSSSELSSSIGVSEGHARKLGNQAPEILSEIYEKNIPELCKSMNLYILQMDGTTAPKFSMIVAVRDSVSGFVLHAKICDS